MAGNLGLPEEKVAQQGHLAGVVLPGNAKPAVEPHPLHMIQTYPFPFLFSQGEAGDVGRPGAEGSRGEKVQSASAQPCSRFSSCTFIPACTKLS